MNKFFTWATLVTYAGAVLATATLTHFLKGLGFIDRIPTRFVSDVIAFAVLTAASVVTGTFTIASMGLSIINAAVVSLASNGGFDAIKNALEKKEE